MNPQEPIRDVMRRTMFNLRLIEKQATDDGPYEVTQLVNSFLGALAHPWERFKNDLQSYSISDAVRDGWPRIEKERTSDSTPRNVGDLLRRIRNGIAHGNIEFRPDQRGDIRAVRIWNTAPGSGKRTWGTKITVDVMRQLLDRFVKLAEQLHERRQAEGERSA